MPFLGCRFSELGETELGLVPTFVFLFIGFIMAFMALLAEWIKKLQIWKYFPFSKHLFKTKENET